MNHPPSQEATPGKHQQSIKYAASGAGGSKTASRVASKLSLYSMGTDQESNSILTDTAKNNNRTH